MRFVGTTGQQMTVSWTSVGRRVVLSPGGEFVSTVLTGRRGVVLGRLGVRRDRAGVGVSRPLVFPVRLSGRPAWCRVGRFR